jgi:hypothetical protein
MSDLTCCVFRTQQNIPLGDQRLLWPSVIRLSFNSV